MEYSKTAAYILISKKCPENQTELLYDIYRQMAMWKKEIIVKKIGNNCEIFIEKGMGKRYNYRYCFISTKQECCINEKVLTESAADI